jgi:hypothetical protein
VNRPKIIHIAKAQTLDFKADGTEALNHHFLAATVIWGH